MTQLFRSMLMLMLMTVTSFTAPAASAQRRPRSSSAARAAQAEVRVCTGARESAQEKQREGHLVEAREDWARCATKSCGTQISHECSVRQFRLEGDLPTFIPLALNAEGLPMDVRVTVDGRPVKTKQAGATVPVNPGVHTVVFSNGAAVLATKTLFFVQGEHNRRLDAVAIERPVPPEAPVKADAQADLKPVRTAGTGGGGTLTAVDVSLQPDPGPKLSAVAPALIGGLGLATVGAGAALIFFGRKDNASKTLYLAGDIALGVGGAALAASTWMFVARGNATSPPGPQPSFGQALRLSLAPAKKGGVALFSGEF